MASSSRHCGTVYNRPCHGAVGNIVERMWESPVLFHVLSMMFSIGRVASYAHFHDAFFIPFPDSFSVPFL